MTHPQEQNSRVSTVGSRANRRSQWHDEAKKMKARGEPIAEIASKLGKNYQAVAFATRDTDYPFGKRARPSQGYTAPSAFANGARAQLAVRFPTAVMSRLNLIAKMEDKSLSSLVVSLVEEALSVEAPKGCNCRLHTPTPSSQGDAQ